LCGKCGDCAEAIFTSEEILSSNMRLHRDIVSIIATSSSSNSQQRHSTFFQETFDENIFSYNHCFHA
jgi:hypothetical protein